MKIRDFYPFARKILQTADEREFKEEIGILIMHYLKLSFTELFLQKDRKLTDDEFKVLNNAVCLRKSGMPIQYIIGSWDFMGISLKVGKGVLIPREDTQVLVRWVLKMANGKKDLKVMDLCSGSGSIALALEKYLDKSSKVYALEYSEEAFGYLSENIKSLESSVKAVNGNVFAQYEDFDDDCFDFIVSNPPYIKSKDIDFLQKEVLHEPKSALDGGEDGYDFYKGICKFWTSKLKKGGFMVFEIGKEMHMGVKSIMDSYGFKNIEFEKDLNGIVRIVAGKKGNV